jgi:hypothetical protein
MLFIIIGAKAMIWNFLFVLALNIGTAILLRWFSDIPFIDTPAIPIMYFIALLQTLGQNLILDNSDELERIKTIFRPIFWIATTLLTVFAVFQMLYLIRRSMPSIFIPFFRLRILLLLIL